MKKIRKYLNTNKSRNSTFQSVYGVAVLKGGVHSDIGLPQ